MHDAKVGGINTDTATKINTLLADLITFKLNVQIVVVLGASGESNSCLESTHTHSHILFIFMRACYSFI